MIDAMDAGREVFMTEVVELLDEMETVLLDLELKPNDKELIGRVFRAMHTIKGSSSMFGVENIAEFTHDIENVFDLVRDGKVGITDELIKLTLEACDQIRLMVSEISNEEVSLDQNKLETILNSYKYYLGSKESTSKNTNSALTKKNDDEPCFKTYLIEFIPNEKIFVFGTNPVILIDELKSLGECKIMCKTSKIPSIESISHELCYVSWRLVIKSLNDIDAIRDVFIFVEDDCELNIDLFDDGNNKNKTLNIAKLAKLFFENESVTQKDFNKIYDTKTIQNIEPSNSASFNKQKTNENGNTNRANNINRVSSIRVSSEKLDGLVDLVGELVIARARLSQIAKSTHNSELILINEDIERLTGDLRETSMSMRLIPIGTLFNKFKRLVHDLSKEQEKEIEFIIEGTETELDKTVIEKLNDPLVHIIRNSIDHGIELGDVREKNGKRRKGTLQIKAFQSGADVVIEVKDDGAGIDSRKILDKALEKGLISSTNDLSEEEILKLIFLPGLSTNRTVTKLSGRGVGMDVVKKNIESLRGNIEIKSELGKGTSITMLLPLTLGIIEGLLVKISNTYYVFPLAAVEECTELLNNNDDIDRGRRIINHRDHVLPFIRLREHFKLAGKLPKIEQILVVCEKDKKIGFAVDEVIGEQQIVIKSLGKMYRNIEGLSGATILGDGNLALILDTQKLIENSQVYEEQRLKKVN